MKLLKILFLFITCVITFCRSQTYSQAYRYPAQRRAGYSYTPTSYNSASSYSKPNAYYSGSNRVNSGSSSSSYPTKSYYQTTTPYRYPAQSSNTAGDRYSSSSRYSSQTNANNAVRSYSSSSSASRYPAQNSGSAVRGYSSSSSSSNSNRYPAQSSGSAVRGYSSSSSSSNSNRYPAQSSSNAVRGYSSSSSSSSSNRYPDRAYNSAQRGTSSTPYSSDSAVRASSPQNAKDYLTNSYYKDSATSSGSKKSPQDVQKDRYQANKADVENAKFAGANNQESIDDETESSRTALHFKRKKLLRRRLAAAAYANRCFPYGRDAASANGKSTKGKSSNGKSATPPPKEQGRFLFDVNVYNVYPQTSVGIGNGCGGYGGSFGGGGGGYGGGGGIFGDNFGGYGGAGLLGDPLAEPIYPTAPGINQFLGQWAPGVLQNALAVTARPQADPLPSSAQDEDLQHDPDVDPDYRPIPVRRPPPNQIYFDSAGATPITPGQLVGGVATTVNGIIQQLTGNVQPVYQSPYRDPERDEDLQNDPIRRRKPNRVYYDSAGAAPVTPAQLVGGTASTVNGIIQQLTGNVQPVYQSSYRRATSYG